MSFAASHLAAAFLSTHHLFLYLLFNNTWGGGGITVGFELSQRRRSHCSLRTNLPGVRQGWPLEYSAAGTAQGWNKVLGSKPSVSQPPLKQRLPARTGAALVPAGPCSERWVLGWAQALQCKVLGSGSTKAPDVVERTESLHLNSLGHAHPSQRHSVNLWEIMVRLGWGQGWLWSYFGFLSSILRVKCTHEGAVLLHCPAQPLWHSSTNDSPCECALCKDIDQHVWSALLFICSFFHYRSFALAQINPFKVLLAFPSFCAEVKTSLELKVLGWGGFFFLVEQNLKIMKLTWGIRIVIWNVKTNWLVASARFLMFI